VIVGIVGHEAAKFTKKGRERAEKEIVKILSQEGVDHVVSGGCHLGGIDEWAVTIGRTMDMTVTEYLPERLSWEQGYKPRNLLIAKVSDVVHSIVVDHLPAEYTGMRFPLCYHCNSKDHVKSGGCWTMKMAVTLGKLGRLHVIKNF
jgi:hypothetical protein